MASSGFDLAIVVGGLTAVGWWLDRKYGWAPWGVLTGAILGIVGGLTNFLREARALMRSTAAEEAEGRGPEAKGGRRDAE
jgi:F0F1-type ATP synthase assembly protein I